MGALLYSGAAAGASTWRLSSLPSVFLLLSFLLIPCLLHCVLSVWGKLSVYLVTSLVLCQNNPHSRFPKVISVPFREKQHPLMSWKHGVVKTVSKAKGSVMSTY